MRPGRPEGELPLDRAIELALAHTREGGVSTSWSAAATPGAPSDPLPSDPDWAGGSLYLDERISVVNATPDALWRVIEDIGETTGWYSSGAAWAVRGLMDRLVGGIGLRRGRRDLRRQEDSAAFLIAARVIGMPRWAALVRSAIWASASAPYFSWNPAMPLAWKFQVSVSVVPPPAGANV
jgi:hypothetical protein